MCVRLMVWGMAVYGEVDGMEHGSVCMVWSMAVCVWYGEVDGMEHGSVCIVW